jgi:hypothetical protein
MTNQTINAAYARAKKRAATTSPDQDYWRFHAEQLKKMLTQAGLTRGRPKLTWKKRWRMIE